MREGRSFVLPGLAQPEIAELTESPLAGGRLWRDRPRASGTLVLVPDLSHDVVLSEHGPVLTDRTIHRTEVPVAQGRELWGFRLPVTATAVRLDRGWEGWRRPDDPEDRLAQAVAAGVISWREDPLLAAFLEVADQPGARVGDLARTLAMPERSLRRHCVTGLGLAPVALLRILRVWRLVEGLRSWSTADAAAEAGFADQPHAARDVRAIAGMTLRGLARFRLAA